ncbi:unnamed protein product [Paramecium sonneborni]|uniref:Uncharacterized protein n=1 Tax=Paramecium sonneborni TaxID=65129 RepID=A0A8S1JT28_9CILI|nr:unnamed protein product [Paramecium sonneborni]
MEEGYGLVQMKINKVTLVGEKDQLRIILMDQGNDLGKLTYHFMNYQLILREVVKNLLSILLIWCCNYLSNQYGIWKEIIHFIRLQKEEHIDEKQLKVVVRSFGA